MFMEPDSSRQGGQFPDTRRRPRLTDGENDNASSGLAFTLGGVADGTRTHDDQNHNLGLYQLSYSHRKL